MSNYLAIAAVTASIKFLLGEVREVTNETIDITSISPNKLDTPQPSLTGQYRLNIFLYNVSLNPGFRNSMHPLRNSTGDLVNNPQIGLDLYYLLSVYSKDAEDHSLIAQRILASAMRILNENPILTSDIINKGASIYLKDIPDGAEGQKILSDLADQKEKVKITFHHLSLDDLSKIWTSFFQTNYCISVGYQATVILLDSKLKKVKSMLPVADRLLFLEQLEKPLINNIIPTNLEWTLNAKIEVIGENLNSDLVRVRFDGMIDSDPISKENMTNNKIVIELPEIILSTVGRKQVQVIHPIMIGMPAVNTRGLNLICLF